MVWWHRICGSNGSLSSLSSDFFVEKNFSQIVTSYIHLCLLLEIYFSQCFLFFIKKITMAFQLYFFDTPVNLDPASSLSLNFVCPAFDDDSAERAYSLPIRLPLTADLQTLLQHRQRLDAQETGDSLTAKVQVESVDLASGVYKLEKSPRGYLDGHFENNARANLASLAQWKLKSLLPTIDIEQSIPAKWYLQVRPQNLATGYAVSIDDTDYSSNTGPALRDAINNRIGETVAFWNSATLNVELSPPSNGRSFKIYNPIPYYNGITLVSTSHTPISAQRASFLGFVQSSLVQPREDLSFAMMQNDKLYDGKNPLWSGLINFAEYFTDDNAWRVGFSNETDTQGFEHTIDETAWRYTYVPFVRVSYILKKIAEKMGVSVVNGELGEWSELMTLLVYNAKSLDSVQQAYEFKELKYTNGYAKKIVLGEHVPDMSAAEFLSQFCETYNLWWQIEDERLVFRKKDALLRGASARDWSAFIVAGSEERGFKYEKGLRFSYKTDESDTATQFAAYTEGAGGELIELPTATLSDRVYQDVGKETCYAEQVRNDAVGVLRFMFDRGRHAEYAGREYQVTASRARLGVLSLVPPSVFLAFWQESARYRAKSWYFSASFNLPVSELRQALVWQYAMRRIETPNGSIEAAINTIEVTERVQGLSTVKIEFFVKN
jgi:hypothetical protein